MRFIKNVKIKHKLHGVIVILMVGFAGIGVAYEFAQNAEEQAVRKEKEINQYGRLIDQVKLGLLRARSNEKDFLLRNQDQYLDRRQANLTDVYQSLHRLEQMTTSVEEHSLIDKIESLTHTYEEEFKKMAQAKVTLGLDENSGLLGELRKTVHALEPVLDTLEKQAKIRLNRVLGDLNDRRVKNHRILFGTVVSVALVVSLLLIMFSRLITRLLEAAVEVARRIASGDLAKEIEVTSKDEIGQLLSDMQTMQARLTDVIVSVKTGADEVSNASQEMSQGNTNLSQRTEEQASSLEETASSMEQMTATVKQNADNARQANQLAAGAREQAEKGGQVVSEAVSAMGEINTSSKQIADIIGVIDEIAFQTNLLALNAAVEAARAGEQGRGFAVVASEVRNLAQRSATAAKEIKGLIQDSVAKVEDGSRLVDESGRTLEDIVTAVKKVSDIVAEIAAASAEQSSGIEQVNKAIVQMDEMTQQNAALVEEAAAASEAMNEQARGMSGLMAFFTVDAHTVVVTEETGASSQREVGMDFGMDFGSARSKHLMWKSRLRRFLNGQEAMSQDQAVSHKQCDLGKWLYSQGLKRYGQLQEMQELEKVHQRLHGVIKRIVEFKHGGQQDQAEREFEQVEPISQKVVSLLNAIERQANQESGEGTSQGSDKRVERRSANRPWAQPQVLTSPKPTPRRKSTGTDGDPELEEF
jgi:methyl-accepting chemotaxis protein